MRYIASDECYIPVVRTRGDTMLFLFLSLQAAWPCAALITTSSGAIATSDAQEVILERTETGTRTRYRVSYDGDAEHFGWLIVVHGGVGEGDVTEADAFAFDDLREATQPRTESYGIGSGGGSSGCKVGCSDSFGSKSAAMAGDAFGADTASAIDVVAEGYAGPFHYQVLDAEEPEALTAWLEDNDFELGGTATTLEEYVAEGGYSFVAVTLTPDDAVTPSEGRTQPALAIESDSDTLHYPARMALTGMAEEVRTTVWLIGDTEAQAIEGWDSEPVAEIDLDGTAEDTYDSLLRAMAFSRDIPTYAQVYSGSLDGDWVTRLDTLAHRSVHTVDPQFDFMVDNTENQTVIIDWGASSEAAVWLILPLLGMGWARRRRT
jgi:hypothetical protein